MDQVNRIEGNQVEIIDYKTGRPKDVKAAAKDLQLGVYALAAGEVLDLDPLRLVFYNLMTNEGGGRNTRRQSTQENQGKNRGSGGPDSRARISPRSRDLAAAFCDYKPLCPAHEQLISIRPSQHASGGKENSRFVAAPGLTRCKKLVPQIKTGRRDFS